MPPKGYLFRANPQEVKDRKTISLDMYLKQAVAIAIGIDKAMAPAHERHCASCSGYNLTKV